MRLYDMDELDLLRDLRPEHELPGTTALLPARSALLAVIAAEQAERAEQTDILAVPTKHLARRRALVGLAAAAAVATGLVIAPWHGAHGPVAAADPVTVLNQAAQFAADQPFKAPRPDQFVYYLPDMWLSVDGTHDGRIGDEVDPGCKNGQRKVLNPNNPALIGTTEPCTPDPAYLADAPTTVPAMRAYLLKRDGGGDPGGLPNRLGKVIDDLFGAHLLSPAAKAVLFRTMTTLPGLRAVPDAVNGSGQHGIGVTWNGGGGTATLVFDRASHRYLGGVTTGVKGEKGSAPARQSAVVDRVGELPR
jgi:hypothetical protein